ncbi:Tetracycline resistance protein TetO [Eubacteriaceae bacterium CHKCI004]|nr:Tetracycline resistance protein TetO [Eubacteriaceae bacterium CHKCI004]
MGRQANETKPIKHICAGLLAHVDAGKTTLSEGILYLTGGLRKLGRVDHGDAFLDNFALERSRGITIFSKQAVFPLGETEVTLIDTPGHVDFSAEMERTLWVMDYAVLVVSGADGIQGHTETLWRLLKAYRIPTFIFVNKMDQDGTDREALLQELKKNLDDGCIAFDSLRMPQETGTKGFAAGGKKNAARVENARDEALISAGSEDILEEIAMCDEDVLETYMETGDIRKSDVIRLIGERKIFPCYFGSALKLSGVETLLAGLEQFTRMPEYPDEFAAKVFKISRDEQGSRLTHIKITGGSLKVKTSFGEKEKVDQIRVYSGAKYGMQDVAEAGTVCALTGLSETAAGQGLGEEKDLEAPLLEPVLSRSVILPEGTDVPKALRQLKQLEEEDPLLHIVWNSRLEEIQMQLMGEVQTEVLKSMIAERYQMDVEFGAGRIMYKETIADTVTGVGHYEPLRHYAEVHLRMEPGERGSGLVFGTDCSEDNLDGNWQRLILTHLMEKEHPGVLAGMPITDMKITLTAGKAHLKHTEGGDFRQATYRAVRQGLMQAESVLLEPWYVFHLELPAEQVGRAMADVQKRYGTFEAPLMEGERAVLSGRAPVSEMLDYPAEVQSYTGGRGRLALRLEGYYPCHNQEEVLADIGYDSEEDVDNPSGSIFCSHGAGFFVPWDQVPDYMHIKEKIPDITDSADGDEANAFVRGKNEIMEEKKDARDSGVTYASSYIEDKELEAIFLREFGSKKQQEDRYRGYRKTSGRAADTSGSRSSSGSGTSKYSGAAGTLSGRNEEKQYLLVDGYNIIFAWDFLKELAEVNLEAARGKLMDILCNYQGFSGVTLIVVFDAYKVKGNPGEIFKYHNIHVVYTKEAETADQYIEKTTHELGHKHQVTVATSDSLEQVIVMGQGARRLSASDFREEVEQAEQEIRRINRERRQNGKNYLLENADDETAELLENVRLGKADWKDAAKK